MELSYLVISLIQNKRILQRDFTKVCNEFELQLQKDNERKKLALSKIEQYMEYRDFVNGRTSRLGQDAGLMKKLE